MAVPKLAVAVMSLLTVIIVVGSAPLAKTPTEGFLLAALGTILGAIFGAAVVSLFYTKGS